MCVTIGDVTDGESHVAVVDLETHTVVAQWPITGAPIPHTAGLNPIHHRLFVGSRIKPHTGEFGGRHQYEPGKLVVINTETGKVAQSLDNVGGADDSVYYDAGAERIYCPGTMNRAVEDLTMRNVKVVLFRKIGQSFSPKQQDS